MSHLPGADVLLAAVGAELLELDDPGAILAGSEKFASADDTAKHYLRMSYGAVVLLRTALEMWARDSAVTREECLAALSLEVERAWS